MELPESLKYTPSHEWIADNGDGTVTIGITAHAVEQLGDLVYVELPKSGASVSRGASCAVVESTKAASDVYAPVTGEVVAANDELGEHPERVNEAPYATGWLFKVRLSNRKELDELMGRDDYAKAVGA
ncbi:MAG: glycine cleavage system protein GcvH [Betaproteobacteria bacterium]